MKRFLCGLLCLCLLWTGMSLAAAEEDTDPEGLENLDDRVIELVKQQYEKAKELLKANKDKLNELAQFLYEKETITGEEFMNILNSPSAYAAMQSAEGNL